jgi:hypothetical protein
MLELYPLKGGLEIAVELLIQAVVSCVCLCVKCSLYLSINMTNLEHAKVARSTM